MSQTTVSKEKLDNVANPKDLELMSFSQVMFHPIRFLIMKILAGNPSIDFRELKSDLRNMVDGNLASHLRALENAGYVEFQKRIDGRKVFTAYAITSNGLNEYYRLRNVLEEWLKSGRL